jgi:hypothetical protein
MAEGTPVPGIVRFRRRGHNDEAFRGPGFATLRGPRKLVIALSKSSLWIRGKLGGRFR